MSQSEQNFIGTNVASADAGSPVAGFRLRSVVREPLAMVAVVLFFAGAALAWSWVGSMMIVLSAFVAAAAIGRAIWCGGFGASAKLSRDAGLTADDFKTLVDNFEDTAVQILDVRGNVLASNTGATIMTGRPAAELVGASFSKIYTAQDSVTGRPQQDLDFASQRGRFVTQDWRMRSDGSCFWADIILSPIKAPAGELRGFCHVARDLTRVKQNEHFEYDRRQIMDLIAQNASINEILQRLVEASQKQFGGAVISAFTMAEGKVDQQASTGLPIIFINALGKHLPRLLGSQTRDTTVASDISIDPVWEPLRGVAHKLNLRTFLMSPITSSKGDLLGAITTSYKTTHEPTREELETLKSVAKLASLAVEYRRLNDALAFQAHHDPLTGLPNRVLMEDRLEQALCQTARNGKMVALLFIDLDRFKNINDTLGHESGDLLLRQVTQRFLRNVRKTDTLVRMGGDEFTLILPDLEDREDAVRVAQKLLDVFKSPLQVAGHELFVSASIGIGVYPQDGKTAAELQKNADIAMYRAKNAGRNTIECFAPEMNAAAIERLQLESQLRRAVENNEFELHYQPQIDGENNLVGLEALVRWRHPKLGMVSPAKFIPMAEETGLIVPLGFWVLKEACRQNKAWQDMGFAPVKVAVNVSAIQFQQIDFVQTVNDALSSSGLDAQWLELELTESLLMDDTHNESPKINKVREFGVGVAIDDFGTGYSSLAYLRRLPIDKLKIDGSFIREMSEGDRDAAVVQAITSLAHSLGMKVIAEGVEQESQKQILLSMGCDMMQGYLFSRPKPAAEIPTVMSDFGLANARAIPA